MMKRSLIVSVLATALSLTPGFALAAGKAPAQEKAQTQKQDQVYGSQLMTQQERTEYGSKMRAAQTAGEREQIRTEHHEAMKVRAKVRGVTLPDEPLDRDRSGGMGAGGGMGPGGGRGSGGGGMGPGGGRGSGGGGMGSGGQGN